MGKEYDSMGATGGVFGDTEVASRRRGGTGHALKHRSSAATTNLRLKVSIVTL